jgi:hypothetical protein
MGGRILLAGELVGAVVIFWASCLRENPGEVKPSISILPDFSSNYILQL